MVNPSIKSITLRNLVLFLLLLTILIVVIIGVKFRSVSKQIVMDKAIAIAETIKAGLTSHMKAGIMEKRGYFLNEISNLNGINRISIIRSESIAQQYGKAKSIEKNIDFDTGDVFKNKKAIFILNEFRVKPTVRAIIPYIASSESELTCTECHHISEGTVLGAIDLEMDITDYRNMALQVMVGLGLLGIVAIILIILNSARTIQKYIKEPLEGLVDQARESYKEQIPLEIDRFKVLEFVNVAKEINLFNADIIYHQELLKEKHQELHGLNDEIEETLRETVFTMGVIEEQRSMETKNHTLRVTKYSGLLSEKLGLKARDTKLIMAASPLHDIGKLGLPDSILLKGAKLTQEEFEVVQQHTLFGYAMLKHSKRDILRSAAIIAHQHHEKWDGTGYPNRLREKETHIYARIVGLADVFDALGTTRVYKSSWKLNDIVALFKDERGKHFDPELIDVFLSNIDEFIKIGEKFGAESLY